MREAAPVSTGKPPCDSNPLCEWVDGSSTFALHLIPSLMARLGIESWMAFKQVPHRGLEIGGILLGRTEARENGVEVWVNGYRTIESEHRAGPSYLLSDKDFERLREELQKSGTEAIGLFRTHTRSEEPAVEPADSEMLVQSFDRGMAVFLLLAPAAGKAAFFARAQGDLKRVYECALSSSLSSILTLRQERPAGEELRAAGEHRIAKAAAPHQPESHPAVVAAAELQPRLPPPLPPAIPPPPPSTGKNKKWMAGAAFALLFLLAIAGGVLFSSRRTAPEPFTPPFLRLTVQPAGSSLRLNWDPSAPVLQGAVYAILHIDDGGQKNERSLNAAELMRGAASYQPRSSNVTFRLDIYPAEPKATGLVQVFNLGPVPNQPAVQPAQPQPASPSPASPLIDELQAIDEGQAKEDDAPKYPSKADPDSRTKPKPQAVATSLRGISAEPLSAGLRNRFRVPSGASGVVVTGVGPSTPAFEAVLEEGDIIQEVNRHPIAGVAEFEQAMNRAGNTAILLSVSRAGVLSYHAIPAP